LLTDRSSSCAHKVAKEVGHGNDLERLVKVSRNATVR